jgi:hypothetical protein
MVDTAPELSPTTDAGAVDVESGARTIQSPSAKGPALVVLGIAVFIVVLGTVGSALESGSAPTLSLHSVTIPDGTVVQLTPAVTAMKSVISGGQPPADIIGNLAVPSGSPVIRSVNSDQGAAQFDRTVYFTSGMSSDQVVDAFHTLLPKLGWDVIYDGSGAQRSGQGTEVLAKRGSGDGFYWEVGAVVSPTTSTGVTPFFLELYELPDDN